MAKRIYRNKDITVFWDSNKCTHSANCIRGLPQVFNVNARPWVNLKAADADEIRRVIDTCPSGALSYDRSGTRNRPGTVTIKISRDGPYKVEGDVKLLNDTGQVIKTRHAFSLCRCGRSGKMPFCDGTHARIGFKDNLASDVLPRGIEPD